MRLLCISDIHGYSRALQRVLAVGQAHRCTQTLVAGDLCFPGPNPLQSWQMLQACQARCVQGVSDRAICSVDPDKLVAANDADAERIALLRKTRSELGEPNLELIRKLPRTFRLATEDGGEILLVHGCPLDPMAPLTHDMADAEIAGLLGDDPPELVICGASHAPFERTIGNTRVVNVGSVGEPAGGQYSHAVVVETSNVGIEIHSFHIPLPPIS